MSDVATRDTNRGLTVNCSMPAGWKHENDGQSRRLSRSWCSGRRWSGTWRLGLLACSACLLLAEPAWAQFGRPHYLYPADPPPGLIGQMQLDRRGQPRAGYFQPVQVAGPKGSIVALALDGHFEPGDQHVTKAGMLIGQVYRLRVSNIPGAEGFEVYPSVEVIDRLCPPPGLEAKFPIPIQLAQEDLELALKGSYVQRVIYLENPQTALPRQEDPDTQRYFDIQGEEDPLRVADRLGRPVAILRMGSRVPVDTTTGRFTFGTPPLIKMPVIPLTAEPMGQPGDAPAAGAAQQARLPLYIERSPAVQRTYGQPVAPGGTIRR